VDPPPGEAHDAGPPRPLKDALAGVAFIGFGLAFAVGATSYEIGSLVRMGPGYVPLLLGGVLVFLGGAIVVKGFVAADTEPIGPIPWRAIALLVGAVVLFGLTVRPLGLVPATLIAAALSAFASRLATPLTVAAIAIGLTAVCVVVFVVALSLNLPLFGPGLRF
jgi:Tripartite tricarboxylate transporter TctB family